MLRLEGFQTLEEAIELKIGDLGLGLLIIEVIVPFDLGPQLFDLGSYVV